MPVCYNKQFMKVEMILVVVLTTWTVEKEPKKIQVWPGIEPGPLQWPGAMLHPLS